MKVIDFNRTFGVHVHEELYGRVFKENPALISLRMKLIREEVSELEQAVVEGDMKETIDALADILYVVYGAGASFGIDLDKAFSIVHESNMSKVCSNEEEAEETVEWYRKNAADYDSKNPAQAPLDPGIRKSSDGKKFVVYNKTTGKVLKSVNYNPADFSSML